MWAKWASERKTQTKHEKWGKLLWGHLEKVSARLTLNHLPSRCSCPTAHATNLAEGATASALTKPGTGAEAMCSSERLASSQSQKRMVPSHEPETARSEKGRVASELIQQGPPQGATPCARGSEQSACGVGGEGVRVRVRVGGGVGVGVGVGGEGYELG